MDRTKGPLLILAVYHFLMAKQSSAFELALPAPPQHAAGYEWLYEAVQTQILQGRLRPGTRLPSTRELAKRYNLSRGTIVNAFDLLKSEGYLQGSAGSGTFVSDVLPDDLLAVKPRSGARTQTLAAKHHLSQYGKRVKLFPNFDSRATTAFRANLPAIDLFPINTWATIAARCMRRASPDMLMGCDPLGYEPLRQAVADYLNAWRGVKCTADQVIIVSGVQEGIDVAARILVNPGDRVCVEDPGYAGARNVFEAYGAKVEHVPVDDEGMVLHESNLRGARLVYVTPAHQAPLGVTMSLRRRLALLEWAQRSEAVILEDDYDSEYRYVGRPVPALQGLDRGGNVIFTGSFNKVLFPSLRLGYIVAPGDLVPSIEAVKSLTSRHAQLLDQVILHEFIADGHFARHIRRMREIYAERRSVLLEAARSRLAGLLEISGVEAGLQTAGWLAPGISGERAAQAAADRNVNVVALSSLSTRRLQRDGLQLGFAAIDTTEIRRGVYDLGIALEHTANAAR